MNDTPGLPFDPESAKARHGAIMREALTGDLATFIEHCTLMLVASVGADGGVDVSPKGGAPGFVRVLGARELAWGEQRGNTMYMTGSNLRETGRVGLCFLDPFAAVIARVNGAATLVPGTMDGRFPDAEYCVAVTADEIFPNCGRALRPLQQQMEAFLGKALARLQKDGRG